MDLLPSRLNCEPHRGGVSLHQCCPHGVCGYPIFVRFHTSEAIEPPCNTDHIRRESQGGALYFLPSNNSASCGGPTVPGSSGSWISVSGLRRMRWSCGDARSALARSRSTRHENSTASSVESGGNISGPPSAVWKPSAC